MVKPQPQDRPPPIDARYRMFLRIAVVVAAYGVYLLVQRTTLGGGVFVGFGLIALGFATVDRLTLRVGERSELMLVGTTLLGAGVLAIGLFLYVR